MSVIRTDKEYDMRKFSTELATQIGYDEAIFISQLEYLISISSAPEKEGHWWTYQSLTDLHKKAFPFWSRNKVWRVKNRLVKAGYVIQSRFNKLHFTDQNGNGRRDRTNWYALDLMKINELPGVYVTSKRVERKAYTQNG